MELSGNGICFNLSFYCVLWYINEAKNVARESFLCYSDGTLSYGAYASAGLKVEILSVC